MQARDPVCGMTIEESEAAGVSSYDCTKCYFCSASCKEKFDDEPAKYLHEKKASPVSVSSACPTCGSGLSHGNVHDHKAGKQVYTFPMHPEVKQAVPGLGS